MKHVVSFSGGKDSTAMLLMMIEKNMPIDEIVFCDTGKEFDEMYIHIDKVEKYIGRPITRLKSDKTFEYYLIEHKINHRNKKNKHIVGYGFPRMRMNRWCTSRLKEKPFDDYLKKYNEPVERYIGIAFDEPQRIKNYNYPLYDWGIVEKQALQYCYDKGFDWGGLYELFNRVSCWCCPLQPLGELKNLYRYFPDKWKILKDWEAKAYNNFRCDYTLNHLEKRFEREVYIDKNQITWGAK